MIPYGLTPLCISLAVVRLPPPPSPLQVMVPDGPCDDTLDPNNDATYTFLATFLAEMGAYFPDEYLFLGGDEVGHTRKNRGEV